MNSHIIIEAPQSLIIDPLLVEISRFAAIDNCVGASYNSDKKTKTIDRNQSRKIEMAAGSIREDNIQNEGNDKMEDQEDDDAENGDQDSMEHRENATTNEEDKEIEQEVGSETHEQLAAYLEDTNQHSMKEGNHPDQATFNIPPPPDADFKDPNEMTQSIKRFALDHGYKISISKSEKNRKKIFKCHRGGHPPESKGTTNHQAQSTSSRLIGCPFQARANYIKDKSIWSFCCQNPTHNHPPFFKTSEEIKKVDNPDHLDEVKSLPDEGFIMPSEIIHTFQQFHTHQNIPRIQEAVYSARRPVQIQNHPGTSPIFHLNQALSSSEFVTSINLNDNGDITDLFFYHPSSIKLLSSYNSILFFDCTYKANRYKMPLIHISGISGNNQSFSVAFCFLSEETFTHYSWALKSLLSIFTTHHIHIPQVFMTGREVPLMNAIEEVFLTTKNMICMSHMNQKIISTAVKLINDRHKENKMIKNWSNLIKLENTSEFYAAFNQFSVQYSPEFIKYLEADWIPLAHKFVNAWTKQVLHFDHRSMPKIDTFHTYIKTHLLGHKHSFDTMVNSISKILKDQEHQIHAELYQQQAEKLSNLPTLFEDCVGKITHYALKKALKNFNLILQVHTNCNGFHRLRTGMPCRHQLADMLLDGRNVELTDFHPQWHIKEIKGMVSSSDQLAQKNVESNPSQSESTDSVQRESNLGEFTRLLEGPSTVVNMKNLQTTQFIGGRLNFEPNTAQAETWEYSQLKSFLKKRLREEQEREQMKRPKLHMEQQPVAPENQLERQKEKINQGNEVPNNQEEKNVSEAPKMRIQKSREIDTVPDTLPKNINWKDELPDFIQPYIEKVSDLKTDGHSGFRAISLCLGRGEESSLKIRQELIQELKKRRAFYHKQGTFKNIDEVIERIKIAPRDPCKNSRPMCMPMMGDAIANTFKTPVFFFSSFWSQTFFPQFSPPNYKTPIFIGLDSSGAHFSVLKLKNPHLFPAPTLLKKWKQGALPEARDWEAKYSACFRLMKSL